MTATCWQAKPLHPVEFAGQVLLVVVHERKIQLLPEQNVPPLAVQSDSTHIDSVNNTVLVQEVPEQTRAKLDLGNTNIPARIKILKTKLIIKELFFIIDFLQNI